MGRAHQLEAAHRAGTMDVDPACVKRNGGQFNEEENLWVFRDGSRGSFSEFEKVKVTRHIKDIPRFNRETFAIREAAADGEIPPFKKPPANAIYTVETEVALFEAIPDQGGALVGGAGSSKVVAEVPAAKLEEPSKPARAGGRRVVSMNEDPE